MIFMSHHITSAPLEEDETMHVQQTTLTPSAWIAFSGEVQRSNLRAIAVTPGSARQKQSCLRNTTDGSSEAIWLQVDYHRGAWL